MKPGDALGLPPPRPLPPSRPVPPPPSVFDYVPAELQKSASAPIAASIATATAGIGWVIWLYSRLAESDTGWPDGTACTGQIVAGYDSCMQRSEIGSLVAWSITLGLGTLGMLVVIRSWLAGRQTIAQALYPTLAAGASASLTAASVWAWVEGASGQYYDAALGATWWNTSMTIGLLVGLASGRFIPIRPDPAATDSMQLSPKG